MVVYLSAVALTAALLGARPTVLRLYAGPRLGGLTVRGFRIELGLLPLGGFVEFGPGGEHLLAVAAWRRLLVALAGPGVLLVLGLALGAPLDTFARGFSQLLGGALAPTTEGARLLRRLASLLGGGELELVALLAVKLAAFNLLPVPALAGFQALQALASWSLGRRVSTPGWLQVTGLLLLGAVWVGWLVALWSVLRGAE
ncbi:MAG: site-2 protease family protein [Myxococcota bacterium]